MIPEQAAVDRQFRGGAAASSSDAQAPGKNAEKNRKKKENKQLAKSKGAGKGGKPDASKIGPCHTCGQYGHLKANCPKNKGKAQQQQETETKPAGNKRRPKK